jgi:hypothetical protein
MFEINGVQIKDVPPDSALKLANLMPKLEGN